MDSLTTAIVSLYRYFVIPLYVLGNVGNLLNVSVFLRRSWRKNVCVFYFLICVLFDVLNLNSTILGHIVIHGFHIDLQSSSVFLCKLYNYMAFFVSTMPATLLILASIDRLLISSRNVDTRLYSSRRLAYFSLSISGVFWFVFYFHVLIKFDVQQFGPAPPICLFDMRGFYRDFLYYSLLVINIGTFLIMVILPILSFKNVHRNRLEPRHHRQRVHTMHKKDFQLLRCLFVRDLVYIVCNIVLASYSTYKAVARYEPITPEDRAMDEFLFNLSSIIRHIPFCTSFLVYVSVSKAFRQELKRLACGISSADQPVSRGAEQNEHEQGRNNAELNVVSTISLRN